MTDPHALLSNAPQGEVSETNDGLQVLFRRHYRRPIAKVWAALTTPERLADWFGAVDIELRAGGTLRIAFNGSHKEIEITEVQAPRLLGWLWVIDGRATRVRFELEPDGEGTRLTLTHSGLSPRGNGHDSMVRAGWHAHLEGLVDAIDGRATPWAVKEQREAALAPLYPPLPSA